MMIAEMIAQLEAIKKEHGNIPVMLADAYIHYDVKWVQYSPQMTEKEHCCIRIKDGGKYYEHILNKN